MAVTAVAQSEGSGSSTLHSEIALDVALKQSDYFERRVQHADLVETRVEDLPADTNLTSTPREGVIVPFPEQPAIPKASRSVVMHTLQEWEGYILELGDSDFTAHLTDLTARSEQAEEAIIPLEEIADDDLGRLQLGTIFRWVIGYERSISGTKRRVSQIVLRDLPAMTEQDRSEGGAWAKRVARVMES